jgi:hypothetical protein
MLVSNSRIIQQVLSLYYVLCKKPKENHKVSVWMATAKLQNQKLDLLNTKKELVFGQSVRKCGISPLTSCLHFAEVQTHLLNRKIHLKGGNLLS